MSILAQHLQTWKQWLPPLSSFLTGGRKPGVRWTARNGARVVMRTARPADRAQIQAFVRGLSVKSRYQRFFYPVHELTPDLLERFTRADPAREVTLLAMAEGNDEDVVIGIAQYVVTDENRGEFAIVVADAWQGEGIGKSMLYALSWLARAAGIVWLDGDVLAENVAMRRLLERAGFTIRSHPEGGNLVRATKRLSRPEGKCARLSDFLNQVGVAPVRQSFRFA
ncbi:MAG TPA: GNAT family N-acetyltransferase [Paucimonas sp.]|nr:GNAT family N-acetyltransferase [Paucimonas sp.]